LRVWPLAARGYRGATGVAFTTELGYNLRPLPV